MNTSRVEAFSDGVIAVIITIMVLELKPPHEPTLAALAAIWPTTFIYVLSFLVVASFWVNHHHLLRAADDVDSVLLWSNMFLLFWLSLIPFVTAYLGDNRGASLAVLCYGVVLTFAGAAFSLFVWVVRRSHRDDPVRRREFDRLIAKGWVSIAGYALATGLAYVDPVISQAIFVIIPLTYFIPNRKLAQA